MLVTQRFCTFCVCAWGVGGECAWFTLNQVRQKYGTTLLDRHLFKYKFPVYWGFCSIEVKVSIRLNKSIIINLVSVTALVYCLTGNETQIYQPPAVSASRCINLRCIMSFEIWWQSTKWQKRLHPRRTMQMSPGSEQSGERTQPVLCSPPPCPSQKAFPRVIS